jgi:hypothetical protein
MKKKKKRILLPALLFAGVSGLFSQTPVRLTNTGAMHVASNGATKTSLYVPASVCMLGANVDVLQNGRTALGGDFVNDITSGNIFDNTSSGWYYFCGSAAQWINGSALKQTQFINFPNVETENQTSVSLDALMGMNVGNLKLSKGKFVLKSAQDATVTTSSQQAHLLVKNAVTYTRGVATPQENGVVEVELYLGTGRNTRFFGWTSPYKTTYSDYLFYNYLLEPTKESLFGPLGKTITDAEYKLLPGRGYLIGQGVYGSPVNQASPEWPDALFSDRFTDRIVFNRYNFKDILNKSIAVASGSDRYTKEELNTENVVMHLNAEGYHFLGNPYTCPLDLSTFVTEASNQSNPWGVSRGDSGSEDVYNMFWVISQGYAFAVNDAELKFSVNVSYLVGQEVGGTIDHYPSHHLIAPMQLFVVYANKELDFTIPKSERKHGNAPFLRSTQEIQINNELLLEVRDNETKGFDRACVVFRPGAHLAANDRYDANKLFNRSGGVSQIWLPTGNTTADKNLSVSVIPYESSSLEVAWLPSNTPQQCTISAYRQESLTAPEQVILLDRQTGIKTYLLDIPEYTFDSAPDDRPDRFVLLFKSPTGIDEAIESALACYYDKTGKFIKIDGITEKDAESTVSVYDAQGRRILQSAVGSGVIPFTASNGVYIVKIAGNRNLNSKIILR